MGVSKRFIAVFTSAVLCISLVPAPAFAGPPTPFDQPSQSSQSSHLALTPQNDCTEDGHDWYLQPSNGPIHTVKCAICSKVLTNRVTVKVEGAWTTSGVLAAAQDDLKELAKVPDLNGFEKHLAIETEGDTIITIDSDFPASDGFPLDYIAQTPDSLVRGEKHSLTIRGSDTNRYLKATGDGIRVQGDLTIEGGDVLAKSGDATALSAGGDMVVRGGRVTAEGCDFGIVARGKMSLETGATIEASAKRDLSYYAAVRGHESITVSGANLTARGGSIGMCASDDIDIQTGTVDVDTGDADGLALFARRHVNVADTATVESPKGAGEMNAVAAAGSGGSVVEGKTIGVDGQPASAVKLVTKQAASGQDGDGQGTGNGSGDNSGGNASGGAGNGGNGDNSGNGNNGSNNGNGGNSAGSGDNLGGTSGGTSGSNAGGSSGGTGTSGAARAGSTGGTPGDSTGTSGTGSGSNNGSGNGSNSGSGTAGTAPAAAQSVLNTAGESDASGSTFRILRARITKAKKRSLTIKWRKVPDATEYLVLGTHCGVANKYKVLDTVTSTSYIDSGLKPGNYYRYIIVAIQNGERILAKSSTVHGVTTGGKYTNVRKVMLAQTSATMGVGGMLDMGAGIVKVNEDLGMRTHVGMRYESSKKSVATVTKKGKVKAKKPGTCYIYAYAQNGIFKRAKITVA